MESLLENFELGAAGISDAVGLTDHAAADLVVKQTADDNNITDPTAIDAAEHAAERQEKTQDVLGKAAKQTATDVSKGVQKASKGLVSTVFGLMPWYVWAGAGVVVVGAGVAVVAVLRSEGGKDLAKAALL